MTTNTDITIRAATRDDFDAWFALYESVAAEGKWIGGELPVDREQRRHGFDAMLDDDDAVSLLAWASAELVGELGVRIQRGIADIGMCVATSSRGKGVGSALMSAAIDWAREHHAHKMSLTLWPHNASAHALYARFGFEIEGLLRRHYRRRNGELWDAVVMGLVLDHDAPGSPHSASD